MKKSVFFRLIIYILIVILFRVIYIIVGYSLGFGSASNNFKSELKLDIIFLFLNIISNWIFLSFISPEKKHLEFVVISSFTVLFYILQFIWFYQNYFFNN